MSFTSLYFLLFLAVVLFVYFCVPKKHRWIVLLIASYIFYILNDIRSIVFIVLTTVVIFFTARQMSVWDKKQKDFFAEQDAQWLAENKKIYNKKLKRKKKTILIFALLFNFGILFALKYFSTFADMFAELIRVEPLNLNILLPLGISFYMFQSVGYLLDVYWGKIQSQNNIFKFGLFVSFFPQLLQGPISRYDQLAPQLIDGSDFNYNRLKSGALLMLWGYFKKLVIADRAGILYSAIMDNFSKFQGLEIFVGMLCFVLKIYCDFSGGIDIARGTAECFGIELTPNFNRPFFALSVTEYWKRWHITLGAWMKDYVLYPLTLSKGYNKFIRGCKKFFKNGVAGKVIPTSIAMFFIFLLVGIWHGPNLTYILFGVYYGVIVLIETVISETKKVRKIEPKEMSKHTKRFIIFLKFSLTFMLVYFGKYLSAAPDVTTAFEWFKATFVNNNISGLFSNFGDRAGFNVANMVILVLSLVVLIVVECLQEKGLKVRQKILEKHTVVQWVIFWLLIFAIIVLTAYEGTGGGFAYENY